MQRGKYSDSCLDAPRFNPTLFVEKGSIFFPLVRLESLGMRFSVEVSQRIARESENGYQGRM
ncbi:hypothetical protein [Coleofasciculus sp. FACHB-1120]|uniref:hypothetical protein n=1 Tax=Coleofasciculus sp. FACHB-1120 TaxID=2692783 RepID=UPI001682B96A|nr:hypothetical protein [Coleofasciculus sp. FACHB-1120]MBD2741978.1 hypothetical protein [Coleofasciculus sp. FACHB-1120]